jgi:LmbE family N-acetylglucosaminyl deacetylase
VRTSVHLGLLTTGRIPGRFQPQQTQQQRLLGTPGWCQTTAVLDTMPLTMLPFRPARSLVTAALLFLGTVCNADSRQRVLLAIFAHPDDETIVAPVLARYARQGVSVYLAIATDGERGVRDHARIPAGPQLAAARQDEAVCVTRTLGIHPPSFFHVGDGELGAITSPPGRNVEIVAERVRELISRLSPDVIVTWGPDGGYGHPDHRLVSDVVTQVVQEGKTTSKLYYVEFSETAVLQLNASGRTRRALFGVDERYLPVRVPFERRDLELAQQAVECHKSQFTPADMSRIKSSLPAAWNGTISFRPWFGQHKSKDLFK